MCCNDYQHKSLCVDIYFHFAWKVCRSRIAESCGKFVFSFLIKCLIIFQSDFIICISTNNGWVFQFLHILTNTCYCLSLSVSSVLFSHSVMSNFLWPMDCSTPGFPVYHQLPELAQTHIHPWCHQLSHPLSSPSPPAFNHSQHQGLFQWVSSSYQVAKILELQFQHQSF